jgi:hypothetical protein
VVASTVAAVVTAAVVATAAITRSLQQQSRPERAALAS